MHKSMLALLALVLAQALAGMPCHPPCNCVCGGGQILGSPQFALCDAVCLPPSCRVTGCWPTAPERCA